MKVTEIKRLIGNGKGRKHDPARLYVAEANGRVWATDSHWLFPVEIVRPLLDHYNVPTDYRGTFDVNSTVTRVSEDTPAIGKLLEKVSGPDNITLTHAHVGDWNAYTRDYTGLVYAILTRPDGTFVTVRADHLAMIEPTLKAMGDYGTRYAFDSFEQPKSGNHAVIVWAKASKRSGGNYRDKGNGGPEWVPERWTETGREIVGLIMPTYREVAK